MGQNVPSANFWMTPNQEEWLICQMVVLPSGGTSIGWRNGLTETLQNSTRGSVKFCTRRETTLCAGIFWGTLNWKALTESQKELMCEFPFPPRLWNLGTQVKVVAWCCHCFLTLKSCLEKCAKGLLSNWGGLTVINGGRGGGGTTIVHGLCCIWLACSYSRT